MHFGDNLYFLVQRHGMRHVHTRNLSHIDLQHAAFRSPHFTTILLLTARHAHADAKITNLNQEAALSKLNYIGHNPEYYEILEE